MKKKRWIIPVAIVGAMLVALIALLPTALRYGSSSGYYLETNDGGAMIIVGNSPIVMSNQTKRDLFGDFKNGDIITVLHDGILESYPGRTGVYAVLSHKSGDSGDIPQSVIDSLVEMGWLNGYESAYTQPESSFDIRVSYAGWSEEDEIYTRALNTSNMTQSANRHLPIYRFDTLEDIEKFKNTFENHLSFEYSFSEIGSFNDAISDYDKTIFDSYSLMLVYLQASSGTYRYGVESIFCNGENFTVYVEELNHPDDVTADLAGWFITVLVPDSMIENCTEFDAIG